MEDEILFKAIQMQATQLNQYTRNIKSFVDNGDVGLAEGHLIHLKEGIGYFENLLAEVKERIKDNDK